MGKAKTVIERVNVLNEREGVVRIWNHATGAAIVSSGTQTFEVSPELVKSFDDKKPLPSMPVTFEVGDVDGKEMVTSLKLVEA